MPKEDIRAVLAAQEEAEGRSAKERTQRSNRLREQVKKGEATLGNRVDDFLFAVWGITPGKPDAVIGNLGKSVHEVERRLAGHTGQLVLMIWRRKERAVLGGPTHRVSEHDYTLESHWLLGVLGDDKVVLDYKDGIGIPTQSYCIFSRDQTMAQGRLMFENPAMVLFSGMPNVHLLDCEIWGGHRRGLALQITVGDDAVLSAPPPEDYFGGSWSVLVNQAARKLGKDVPFSEEEEMEAANRRTQALESLDDARDRLRRHGDKRAQAELETALSRARELAPEDLLVKLVERELGNITNGK